jgi:8-oxo-dGTP pyrophosphatase MutT (NUDIX family)
MDSWRRKRWVKKAPKRFATSVMMIETRSGEILVVKSNYKSYWTLPGGVIDPGESPLESAMRETFEEVGVTVDPAHVTFVAVVDRRSDIAETYQFIFKTVIDNDMRRRITLQATEIQESAFVTKQQVRGGDRPFAKSLTHWVNGTMGYIEKESVDE